MSSRSYRSISSRKSERRLSQRRNRDEESYYEPTDYDDDDDDSYRSNDHESDRDEEDSHSSGSVTRSDYSDNGDYDKDNYRDDGSDYSSRSGSGSENWEDERYGSSDSDSGRNDDRSYDSQEEDEFDDDDERRKFTRPQRRSQRGMESDQYYGEDDDDYSRTFHSNEDIDFDDQNIAKQDKKTRQKLIAIVITIAILVFLITGVALGVALSKKQKNVSITNDPSDVASQIDNDSNPFSSVETPSNNSTSDENTSGESPEVPNNSNSTTTTTEEENETSAPGTTQVTDPNSLGSTTPSDNDEDEPNADSEGNDNEDDEEDQVTTFPPDGGFFNDDGFGVVDEDDKGDSNATDPENVVEDLTIPEYESITANGDTFILTIPEGSDFEKEPGAPPNGLLETLLVQGFDPLFNTDSIDEVETDDFVASSNFTDGNVTDNIFAKEEDNDGDKANVLPSSYALINFYMGDKQWYRDYNTDLPNYRSGAFLCLEHVPNTSPLDPWKNPQKPTDTKVFSICRIDNSLEIQRRRIRTRNLEPLVVPDGKAGTGGELEKLADETAKYSMPDDCRDGEVSDFVVRNDDTSVCVDVSSFIDNYPPFVADGDTEGLIEAAATLMENDQMLEVRNLRGRDRYDSKAIPTPERVLQKSDADTIVDQSNYKNVLFMIANTEEGQAASAQFKSRESLVDAPSLLFELEEIQPTISPSPTMFPTWTTTITDDVLESNSNDQTAVPNMFDSMDPTTDTSGSAMEAPPEVDRDKTDGTNQTLYSDTTVDAMEAPPELYHNMTDGTNETAPNVFDHNSNTHAVPSSATSVPSISPSAMPSVIPSGNSLVTLEAIADTYMFAGKGGNAGLNGKDTSFKLQNTDWPSYPYTFALIAFEPEWENLPNQVDLCLTHTLSEDTFDYINSTLRTCLVPFIDEIEGLVGTDVDLTVPSSCIGGSFAEFEVTANSTRVCVDVTSLLQEPDVFPETEETKKLLFVLDKEEVGVGIFKFWSRTAPPGRGPKLEYYDDPSS